MEGLWDASELAASGVQPGLMPLDGTSGSYSSQGLRTCLCWLLGSLACCAAACLRKPLRHAKDSHDGSAAHVQCKRLCHRTAAAGTPATAPTSAAPWQASPWSQDGAAAHAGGRPPLTAEHVCGTTLDRLPDHERPSLAGNACGLSGGDAATLLDLQELLLLPPSEQPDLCDLLTGHESDGSGCSGASHLSVRSDAAAAAPAQPPLLSPGWCMPSPPHQQQPHSVSMPGGCLPMMPVPADSLHVRPAPAEGAALCGWLEPGWESGTAGDDASDTDLMQWLVSAVPDSTGSSPGRAQQEHAAACLPGQSAGAGSAELCAALSGSMVGAAPAQSRPAVGCGTAASAPCKKRGRGRPRRYDTTLPLSPGLMQAQMGGALSNQVNGMDEGQRKKTRGAKPKYKFQTAEEAVAYRRERNRTTALASYEKRKARETALKAEIAALAAEQDALKVLLVHVQQNKVDQERLQSLFAAAKGSPAGVLVRLNPGQAC